MATLRESDFNSFLNRQIKASSGILIYGDDSAGIDELVRGLCTSIVKSDTQAVSRFSGSELEVGQISNELRSSSLFGEKRVVIISDASENLLAEILPLLAIADLPNYLVVTASSLNKSSKLRVAFEVAERFHCLPLYEPTAEMLAQRVQALLAKSELKFATGASEAFFEVVGSDRAEVMREAEKLVLYCHGQSSISDADIAAVCGDIASFSTDQLIDAVLSGDMFDADRMLGAVETDVAFSQPPLMALQSHLRRLQELRGEMAKGQAADAVIASAKPMIFFGRRRVFSEHLRRFDLLALEEIQAAVANAIFESRKMAELAPALISRCILNVAWLAKKARQS